MRRVFALLVAVLAFAGCMTSADQLAKVSVGMTKAQVTEILGAPASVSAHEDGTELLRYELRRTQGPRFPESYTVQFRGGQVVAYGRDDEFRTLHVKAN